MAIKKNSEGNIPSRSSRHLQRGEEQYENMYKDFFQGRNLILSGHNILTWGSDISHGISVIRIKQKLPTKIYCGANMNTSGRITFGKIQCYSESETTFHDDKIPLFSNERLESISSFLEDFLQKHDYTGGAHIDFLSEIPSGHGFASSSTISVLLTFLVYIIIGELDPKILQSQDLTSHKELHDEIYDFSLKLSNHISGGNSIGASNYAIMAEDMPLPIVHFSQKCNHLDTHGGNIMNEDNTDIHIPIHRTLYKDSVHNFFGYKNQEITELPIDYGILFGGLAYRFDTITKVRDQTKREKVEIVSKIQDRILRLSQIQESDKDILGRFFQNYAEDVFSSEADEINMEILYRIGKLFDTSDVGYSVTKILETLQKAGLWSFSYQQENPLFLRFKSLFYTLRQFEDEEIAILPFNSGKIGGSLFFVTKNGESRETIQKVLGKIKDEGSIVSLDYVSWIDGYTSKGIQIEQFISEKIFSPYTKEGDVFFTDTSGKSYSGEYDTIIKKEVHGILLDTIGGRIYIKGVKLTSKEIHSQNTTIDMLKILIENIGKEVSNGRLPLSTYSQNKNELLGKVVIPIKKLSQQHFGMELSLTCSGGITQYYIRLEKDNDIPIGIIDTLYH